MSIIRFFPMSLAGSALAIMSMFLPACTVLSGGFFTEVSVRELTLLDSVTSDIPSDGFHEDDMWVILVAAGALASIVVRVFGLLLLAGAVRLIDLLDFRVIDGPSSTPEFGLYLLVISSFIILVGPVSSMEFSGDMFKVRVVRSLREYLEGLSSVGFRVATPKIHPQRSP